MINVWLMVEQDESTCLGIKLVPKVSATHINFSDVYAAEFTGYGIIHGSTSLLGHDSQVCMFIFLLNLFFGAFIPFDDSHDHYLLWCFVFYIDAADVPVYSSWF